MGVNSIRVAVPEGSSPLTAKDLARALNEITQWNWGHGMFVKFIRSDGLISRTEFYRDAAKTNLAISRDYTRVSGVALQIQYPSEIVTTFYEEDGVTIDSIVSGFLERDLTVSGEDAIICCSGFFDTDESEKL